MCSKWISKRGRMTSLSVYPLIPIDKVNCTIHMKKHDSAPKVFYALVLCYTPIHQLVETLRGTLPNVCIINTLQERADSGTDPEARTTRVWHVSKAAGWYRTLYRDSRLVLCLSLEVLTNMKLTLYY